MKTYPEQSKTSRQLQAERTKHNIYMTARKLIADKGFDNVTIEEVCRTAGISKGLFYHYYKSKDDIIIEGYSECDDYFETHVRNSLSKENFLDRIVEFIDYQILYADKLGIDVLIQAYKSQIQHGNDFFVSEGRSLPVILKEIIDRGKEKGDIRIDLSTDYITNFILRFSRGLLYDWCLHDGNYDIKESAHEAVKRLVELFRIEQISKNPSN
ncbi:MAG: TetR/AcrR family transcriptional regulator [Spirochaetales bacterium]|nr:TetR/AcrR family transcriptional regulator [Spirochaetales bacterium]